jgi:predicted solute-binding protein
MTTQTELKAKEILNYMVENLAEGVYIKKSLLKEYLKEICFIIDNS